MLSRRRLLMMASGNAEQYIEGYVVEDYSGQVVINVMVHNLQPTRIQMVISYSILVAQR